MLDEDCTAGHEMAAVQQQQTQQQQQQQQSTQLEFNQAMTDFKTMFPEMDTDVIEAVLRANQGAVDATIDQLLAMSTDNENERIRSELEKQEQLEQPPSFSQATGCSPPPSYQQAVPGNSPTSGHTTLHRDTASRDSSTSPKLGLSTSPSPTQAISLDAPLKVIRGWNPPLLGPLPEDFLRISGLTWKQPRENMVLSTQLLQQKYAENQQKRGALGDVNDPDLARYLEDERIALFLQNEEFMQELRRNKDFMTTLENDQENVESPPDEVMGAFPYTKPMPGTHEDDAMFKERLRNMGKMSRKKFAQLARVFHRRKKRSAKQILSRGEAPSKDNLLLNAEPLLVEEEEEEETGDEERLEPIPEGPSVMTSRREKPQGSGKFELL